MKAFVLLGAIFILSNFCQGQDSSLEYKPVTGTNLEESFPIAANMIMVGLKLGLFEFDYSSRILKSTYFEYYRGLSLQRGRWLIEIDENGTLNIQITDIQWYHENQWKNSGLSFFSKKEEKMRAAFANDLRNNLLDEEVKKETSRWFYTNLEVNRQFYEIATDLAGERWFNLYLKDQPIEWDLTFIDIEKNPNEKANYKYMESYTYLEGPTLSQKVFDNNKFFISKYTDDDSNVLSRTGNKMTVKGYCRILEYKNGKFYILLTDQLETAKPQTTLVAQKAESNQSDILEMAEKLKKLKELLDLEVITQEEFETEKAKLLSK